MNDLSGASAMRAGVRRGVMIGLAIALLAVVALWTLTRGTELTRNEPTTVSWQSASLSVAEDAGLVEITARLSAPAQADTVIELQSSGTSSVDEDYRLLVSSLGIPAGQTTAVLPILVINDGPTGEGRESLQVVISSLSSGTVGPRDTFTLIIEDQGRPVTDQRSTNTTVRPTATTTTTTTETPTTLELGPIVGDLGVTELTTGSETVAQVVSLEPFVAEPNTIVLLLIASASKDAPTILPVPESSEVTWELVETSTRNGGPRRVSMFRASSGSGGTIATTVKVGLTQEVVNWVVVQVDNAPAEFNGATAVVQTGAAAAIDFEFSAAVELQPLRSPESITIGAFFIGANNVEALPGSQTVGSVGPTLRLLFVVAGNTSLVGTADWSNRAHWIGVAAEFTNR